MSDRFTPEDIELLRTMPTTAAMMVVAIDTNGVVAAVKEMAGMSRAIESGIADYPANALLRLIHAELHTIDHEAIAERKRASKDKEKIYFIDEAVDAFFVEVDKVVALVDQQAPGDEGLEYRQWVYSVAEGTAEASKESGFLGFGGKRVSEAEASFLADLKARLRI